MAKGNLEGVKKSYIKLLDDLIGSDFPKDVLVPFDVLTLICDLSDKINKEIAIFISRRGRILDVAIGDDKTVAIQGISEKRGEYGLSGVRCIHTHPSASSELSAPDLTALINLRLDLMAAVSTKDGEPKEVTIGFIDTLNGELIDRVSVYGPYNASRVEEINFLEKLYELEDSIESYVHKNYETEKERVILVTMSSNDGYTSEESLDELQELVETAGAEVVHKVIQNKFKVDPAYYIGSGKAEEIGLLSQSLMADTVVFDDELNGAQVRNLEEIINCKVIDRTSLILDIFAQRAKSREGKIQVELAQLKYRLPRLIGFGGQLSRTGGGIGTRGPGEKKLETDRRHIKGRIYDLETELKGIKKSRALQRERREANEVPVISIAGYTNAGKSTLRNKLCEMAGLDKEKVFEANMLFATLDTTTRMVALPSGKNVLISDTVGFIRKLPHDLVEAFKSTLEEVAYSNLILHLVDASNEKVMTQIETVNGVLGEIGAGDKHFILVANKIDKASEETLNTIRKEYPDVIEISALENINLDSLLQRIEDEVFKDMIEAELMIPYDAARIASYLHDNNCVEFEEYREDGILLKIKTTQDVFGRVREYAIEK